MYLLPCQVQIGKNIFSKTYKYASFLQFKRQKTSNCSSPLWRDGFDDLQPRWLERAKFLGKQPGQASRVRGRPWGLSGSQCSSNPEDMLGQGLVTSSELGHPHDSGLTGFGHGHSELPQVGACLLFSSK